MKTPREILLARHQSAVPKLDAIRREIVAELNNKEAKAQSLSNNLVSWRLGGLENLWLELIWPSRQIWAGLAAVWVLIIVANCAMRDHSQPQIASAPPSPQILLAFRQQEQLLTELIGPAEPPVAEPAKPSRLLPTSLRQGQIVMA
jgi:hypothetical protein